MSIDQKYVKLFTSSFQIGVDPSRFKASFTILPFGGTPSAHPQIRHFMANTTTLVPCIVRYDVIGQVNHEVNQYIPLLQRVSQFLLKVFQCPQVFYLLPTR